MKNKKLGCKKMSLGIFINMFRGGYLYNLEETSFTQVEPSIDQQSYSIPSVRGLVSKYVTKFEKNSLIFQEKMLFIKHVINSFPANEDGLSMQIVTIDFVKNYNHLVTFTRIPLDEAHYYLTYYKGYNRNDLYEAFLFFVTVGNRFIESATTLAIHEKKQKAVNAELECKPNVGVVFQNCKESFESKQ